MNETLIFVKIRAVLKKYRDWSCIYQERNEQWMKRWFSSSKYELCWKSIETEAVFTKREMNNEWNVDFLQNTSCVEKVSRLKLYLPREKWTMNETLIFFFKIRAVLKKYRDWSCIYQERNEQWMKRWFSSKYELCWKSIVTEAVFTKREMNNEWNVDFLLQNTSCVEKVSRLKLYLPKEKWKEKWTMNETLTLIFFFKIKIRAVLNEKYRIETEAVFTKREMSNEWNVDFLLQNTSCVEKVSWLKLYLPREKWTMNEMLIFFFKIRAVLKKYRDWSCIYQERNEQWMKRWFSSKYELCWKSIETEAVFTKREMNNEWNVDFRQNTSCVEKVSRLKLYLPRQEWAMNETLIFLLDMRSVEKYWDIDISFWGWNRQT